MGALLSRWFISSFFYFVLSFWFICTSLTSFTSCIIYLKPCFHSPRESIGSVQNFKNRHPSLSCYDLHSLRVCWESVKNFFYSSSIIHAWLDSSILIGLHSYILTESLIFFVHRSPIQLPYNKAFFSFLHDRPPVNGN